MKCPGNSSQFCGGDSWYTFHLMYLWVGSRGGDLFWNAGASWEQHANVHDSLSDYFNEIVPCICTCPSGQHLASHESVCDLLLRKCVVRQRRFEIKCASVSHVAHAEVQSLCQEGTENSGCDVKCIEGYTPKSCGVPSSIAERFTHFCGTILSGLCRLHLQIWVFSKRIELRQERVLIGV